MSSPGKFSRDKGQRAERYFANQIRAAFPHLDIRRGNQSRQGDDEPDLVGFHIGPFDFWVECKWCETWRMNEWHRQMELAAGDEAEPVLYFTKNNAPTYVSMHVDTWHAVLQRLNYLEQLESQQ